MTTANLSPLHDIQSLEEVLQRSFARPQLLFKHSLTCPLSSQAYQELQRHMSEAPAGDTDYWIITVQTDRGISDRVERRLEILHESPQAILVRDGRAVWNASHRRITAAALAEALGAAEAVAD